MTLRGTDPLRAGESGSAGRERISAALLDGRLTEIEVAWADHLGHTLGKRIPAAGVLETSDAKGFGFCDATLSWDVVAELHEGARLTGWETGYPDLFAKPELDTFRFLPWRPGVGQVVSDVVAHGGEPVHTAPRTVLRRVVERLAELGYRAEIGVEIEFFLLDPALTTITEGLAGYVPVEGVTSEYGPAQLEINLHHADPLTAADDGFRLKYAVRALARRAGARATFMAKPFQGLSGSSMHLHLSLWRDGEPAFAPVGGAENPLMRSAIAGILVHLPAITVFGAPSINSYKRFESRSYAPSTASWGGDNRTAAVPVSRCHGCPPRRFNSPGRTSGSRICWARAPSTITPSWWRRTGRPASPPSRSGSVTATSIWRDLSPGGERGPAGDRRADGAYRYC
jgi:glutamine synthetase